MCRMLAAREGGGSLPVICQPTGRRGLSGGIKPVPGSCAVDVSRHFCCNVILLFVRQAGVSLGTQLQFIRSIFGGEPALCLLVCVGIHVLTDNCLSDALMDLSWADGFPSLPTQQQPPLPKVTTNWF